MPSVFESSILNEDARLLYIDQHPGKSTNAKDSRKYLQPRIPRRTHLCLSVHCCCCVSCFALKFPPQPFRYQVCYSACSLFEFFVINKQTNTSPACGCQLSFLFCRLGALQYNFFFSFTFFQMTDDRANVKLQIEGFRKLDTNVFSEFSQNFKLSSKFCWKVPQQFSEFVPYPLWRAWWLMVWGKL